MKGLNSLKYWKELLYQSQNTPIIIFKHSNTCGSSLTAYNKVKELEKVEEIDGNVYLVVAQNDREVSDKIARDVHVEHETPQVLLVYKGSAEYCADHSDIDKDVLLEKYMSFAVEGK